MSPPRIFPIRFIAPCLPIKAPQPPSGDIWLHEIKLDGFRVIACKDGERVRLFSRPGNDLTKRFPLIAEAVAKLRPRSCIIDGEAVVLGDDGLPSFDRLRYRRRDASVILVAFDLIELNGEDVRPRSRSAGLRWPSCSRAQLLAFNSTSTSRRTARPSLSTLASSGLKASRRSVRARATAQDARRIGSRARTRPLRQ
jgi:ATP dependent DNA ligase domain